MLSRDRVWTARRQYFLRPICRWARLARRFRTGILLLNSSKETLMKTRNIALTIVLCLFALSLVYAADSPFMGTWKLNDAKSSIPAGTPKSNTVTYAAAAGGMISVTIDGVDGAGKPTHTVWTGKFDGKPYPVTGASGQTRSVKAKGERELELELFQDGKSTGKGKTEVAKDGKTRTVELEGMGADGKKSKSKAVYDKQ
jgi:hypothetical protein